MQQLITTPTDNTSAHKGDSKIIIIKKHTVNQKTKNSNDVKRYTREQACTKHERKKEKR